LHFAIIGLEEPRNQLEERALPATVATDETDALTFVNRTADAIEKESRAVTEAKIGKCDEGHSWIDRRLIVGCSSTVRGREE
jgi:hypothetical protein